MSTATIKHFTPREAKKTLPLVKKIVKDILDSGYQIRSIAESMGGEDPQNNPEVRKLVSNVNYFMNELEEIGCYYKDWNFSIGIVDFPSIINDREVFLCWRSDEEDILYYHGIEDGYMGRKPIPNKYFTNN